MEIHIPPSLGAWNWKTKLKWSNFKIRKLNRFLLSISAIFQNSTSTGLQSADLVSSAETLRVRNRSIESCTNLNSDAHHKSLFWNSNFQRWRFGICGIFRGASEAIQLHSDIDVVKWCRSKCKMSLKISGWIAGIRLSRAVSLLVKLLKHQSMTCLLAIWNVLETREAKISAMVFIARLSVGLHDVKPEDWKAVEPRRKAPKWCGNQDVP